MADREHEMAKAIEAAEAIDDDEKDEAYARPKRPRQRAGDVYTFRLPSERRQQLRRAADVRGVPPATLIREWIEDRLDSDDRRSAAARTIAELADRLFPLGLTATAEGRGASVILGDIPRIDVVPEFDVAPLHRAFSDLTDAVGLVPTVAAATAGVHRALAAALVELDVVNERLVKAVSDVAAQVSESPDDKRTP